MISSLTALIFCLFLRSSASCGIGARDYYAPFDSSTNAGVLSAVQKALGRTVETQIPTRTGATARQIFQSSELSCPTFGQSCRWHNVVDDQLDWTVGTGNPDTALLQSTTGTGVGPSPPYALLFSGVALPVGYMGKLVSDPVGCIRDNAEISFRYWLTRDTQLKVCMKQKDAASSDYCSPPITRGSPGPAFVRLPGPRSQPFEIYFEGQNFRNVDDFIIVDEIEFNGEVCNRRKSGDQSAEAVQRNLTQSFGRGSVIPRDRGINSITDFSLLGGLPSISIGGDFTQFPVNAATTATTCQTLHCDFSPGSGCAKPIRERSTPWLLGQGFTGNRNTGIPGDPSDEFSGTYAYIAGPVHDSEGARLKLPPVTLETGKQLQFQYYKASLGSEFELLVDGQRLFHDEGQSMQRQWRSSIVDLGPGANQEIVFVARKLGRNQFVGLDQLKLLNSDGTPFCIY